MNDAGSSREVGVAGDGEADRERGGREVGGAADEFFEHTRAAGRELAAAAGAAAKIAKATRERVDLDRRVREHPAQTLLIAAGAGYLAGGGFFTPFTGTMLRVGTRLWLVPALRSTLFNRQENDR